MEAVAERKVGMSARSRGFTLLELMITMAMLVLCTVPVMQLMAAGIAGDDAVERQVIAQGLAQEKMEEIKNASWGDLPGYASAAGKVDGDFPDYDREVTVEDTDKDLRTVTVTVYWDLKGVKQQVSLVTLRTNLKP